MSTEITRRAALKRLAVTTAGVAVGGNVLAACGSSGGSSSGRGSGPIKVGVLTDLTGAYGIVGASNRAIAEFTVNEINAAGGVMGRRLELVVVDGASDPATNAKVAGQLVTQDRVAMVIGGVTSAEREAVKEIIASRGRTLYVWPASYEGGECDENVWSVGAVPNQQVDPTVDYLLGKGARTFYLCGNDYSYPRNVLKAARERIEAGGGRVVGEDYIPVNATDPSNLVTRTLAARADATFEVVILPASVPYIKGVAQGGYRGLIAGTLFDETLLPLYGSSAKGIICAQDYFATISDAFSRAETARYRQRYPKQAFGSALNSPAFYRGLYLWKAAVEKAGSTDLSRVNAAMDSISYDKLIGGPAKMVTRTRHAELPMYLGEMQTDGTVKVLKDLGSQAPKGAMRLIRGHREAAFTATLVVAVIAAGPILDAVGQSYWLIALTRALLLAALAVSTNLAWGITGIFTLGQAVFFGIGAYAAGLLATRAGVTSLPLLVAATFGAGLLSGVLIGMFLFFGRRRVGELYVGLVTLALTYAFERLATTWDAIGAGNGLPGLPLPTLLGSEVAIGLPFFWLALGTLLVTLAIGWMLVRSQFGLVMRAVRDDDERAEFLGYRRPIVQLVVFALAGALAGVAGGLYALEEGFVATTFLGVALSTQILVYILLGGRGTLIGPVLGVLVLELGGQRVQEQLPKQWPMIVGALLLAVILFRPNGLMDLNLRLPRRARSSTTAMTLGATGADPGSE